MLSGGETQGREGKRNMKYLNYRFHVTNYQNYRMLSLAFTNQTFFPNGGSQSKRKQYQFPPGEKDARPIFLTNKEYLFFSFEVFASCV